MTDTQAILARCRELGAKLTPTPHGTLRVKAPTPIPDSLRSELRRHKEEIIGLLKAQRPASVVRPETSPPRPFRDDARFFLASGVLPWPCPSCGGQVKLDQPAKKMPAKFWTCQNCHTWGATREGAHAPVTWITTQTVQ